jgi:hypothetical protein
LVGAQFHERLFLLSYHYVKNSFQNKIVKPSEDRDLGHDFDGLVRSLSQSNILTSQYKKKNVIFFFFQVKLHFLLVIWLSLDSLSPPNHIKVTFMN